MLVSFETLQIDAELVKVLHGQNITEPSPIQAQAIPAILEGKDVIAQSQTGTGKTLAYLLPVLQKLDLDSKHVQAMILVPTRELGMQIVREIEMFSRSMPIKVQPLIGGAALSRQVDRMKLHPHIVVGTPGRVQELLKMKKLSMHFIKTIVVDEVDQMFDLGSMNEVEAILKSALRDRQILFFSATVPAQIKDTAHRWMNEPVHIEVNPGQITPETVEHLYFVCEERHKIDTLRRLVRLYNPHSAIVFINDTDQIAEVVAKLQFAGLSIEALYGEALKVDRVNVLNAFREGKFQLLLATDVAARGLDIKQLTHVINFDLPVDADHYVHRTGRTGRMGRSGTAISIVTPKQRFIIDKFCKALGISIELREMYGGKVYDPLKKRNNTGSDRNKEAGATTVNTRKSAARSGPLSSRIARAEAGSTPKTNAKRVPVQPAKQKSDRERDRKNKGAPKWLKEKSRNDG